MITRQIDFATRDYVAAPKGTYAYVTEVKNKIALSFAIELGSWEGAPDIGHELHLVEPKNSPSNLQAAKSKVESALRWLIDSGELDSVNGRVLALDSDGIYFEADCHPSASSVVITHQGFVALGGG